MPFFPCGCIFFTFKQANAKYLLQKVPAGHVFPVTLHEWPDLCFCGFVFSGVDGLSIDITTMVDIRDQTNKELAMRLVTDIQSGDVFYTDLNGFQVSLILCNKRGVTFNFFVCCQITVRQLHFW